MHGGYVYYRCNNVYDLSYNHHDNDVLHNDCSLYVLTYYSNNHGHNVFCCNCYAHYDLICRYNNRGRYVFYGYYYKHYGYHVYYNQILHDQISCCNNHVLNLF